MSAPSNPLRDMVVSRAGNCCEYCQLPAQLQIGGFEIDHDGEDRVSGQAVGLFNPRTQAWGDHFQWSAQRPGEQQWYGCR